jgi:hypothetical protein
MTQQGQYTKEQKLYGRSLHAHAIALLVLSLHAHEQSRRFRMSDGDFPLAINNLGDNVIDRKKRSKKTRADYPSLKSAGSFEEPVRSQ